jgi:hypothetical protein
VSVVRTGRDPLPKVTVKSIGGDVLRPVHRTADRLDFRVAANGRLLVGWA